MAKGKKNKQAVADSQWPEVGEETVILGGPDAIDRRNENIAQERPETIRQAMIVDGSKLTATYTMELHAGIRTINDKYPEPIHDDLRNAFAKLNEHLGRLCFQPLTEHNPAHKENRELPALICHIHCVGFKLSGNKDNDTEKVTLYGSRTLPNANTLPLESPTQAFDGGLNEYEEADDLRIIVNTCIREVELYLFEGKHRPDNQLSLFPDEVIEEEPEQE